MMNNFYEDFLHKDTCTASSCSSEEEESSNDYNNYYDDDHAERAQEALSDLQESLELLRNKFVQDCRSYYDWLQQQSWQKLWHHVFEDDEDLILCGYVLLSVLLVVVIIAVVVVVRRRRRAAQRELEAGAIHHRGSKGKRHRNVRVDGIAYRSALETESAILKREADDDHTKKFFPVPPSYRQRVHIAIPKGMVIQSSQIYDITLGPVKRWGNGKARLFSNLLLKTYKSRKCRIALEIMGPANRTVDLQSSEQKKFVVSFRSISQQFNIDEVNDDDNDSKSRVDNGDKDSSQPDGHYLADDEYIQVRLYRRKKELELKRRALQKKMKEMKNKGVVTVRGGEIYSNKNKPINTLPASPTSAALSDASVRSFASTQASTDVLLSRGGGGAGGGETDDDDDDSVVIVDPDTGDEIVDDDLLRFPMDMLREWVSYKEYKGIDCQINKCHGKFMEIQLGTGMTSEVRDLTFQSTQHREQFQKLCYQLLSLSQDRTRRQLKEYRKVKQENDDAKNGNNNNNNNNKRKSTWNAALDAVSSHAPKALQKGNQQQRDDGGDDQQEEEADETLRLLLEIVSATDLPGRFSMDPYVVVQMGERVIHKTSVLVQTKNPIWTIKTGSLFLLCAAPQDLIRAGRLKFSLLDFNTLAKHEVIGSVYFTVKQLLAFKGERIGYDLVDLSDHSDDDTMTRSQKSRLYLRIREATTSDVQFMRDLENNFGKDGVYSGETLLPMRPPQSTLLKFQTKTGEEHEVLHRVRPFPDPDREQETTWLSSDDIYRESMMSSSNWVELGSGNVGKLYVEILGCTKLPNMDRAILGRKTDAFASLVFEDAAATTDVVGQCLSPRWMPWSRRAFVFNIESPSSALFIGIFDHDPEPPANLEFYMSALVHDPIGRIEVQVSMLEPDTLYTLAFPLYFGDNIEERQLKEKGKVWIRIRKEWADFKKAMYAGTAPAPLTVLSMDRPIDYRTVRYTTVGPRDDTGFSIWKFTEYIQELQDYQFLQVYVKDFIFNTWLWRGHYRVKICGLRFLLPLHSMTAFFWGVAITSDFNKVPSFLLFSIGWLLLASNEAINTNPSPWHKCPQYYPHIWSLLLQRKRDAVAIAPYQHLRSISKFDGAREKREKWAERERELLEEQQRQMQLDLHGFESGEEYNNVLDITTVSRGDSLLMRFLFPLKPVLYPIQKKMRQVVIYCRVATSILFWEESEFAFWIATACFVGSFVMYKIPFSFLIGWTLKISAWVFLGPWMKLAERYYFTDNFKQDSMITDQERDERIKEHMREQYENLMETASNYQIRKEDIVKLESMKSYMFGPHHVRVPRFRERRFKDTPLPESYAEPYGNGDDDDQPRELIEISERKYGQKLSGNMIPQREFEAYSARDDYDDLMGRRRKLNGYHHLIPGMSLLADQLQLLSTVPTRVFTKTRDMVIERGEEVIDTNVQRLMGRLSVLGAPPPNSGINTIISENNNNNNNNNESGQAEQQQEQEQTVSQRQATKNKKTSKPAQISSTAADGSIIKVNRYGTDNRASF